ncbi:MAG TPA: DinB family protein [Mycobacteriales bacterium]|nr:DinB family protein [Mycobacteriales bacterium]
MLPVAAEAEYWVPDIRYGRETSMGPFDVLLDDERTQLEAFIEDYRRAIEAAVEGLTEEQARRRLVPSATTVLGLLKHVTWMQRVWFEVCVGGMSRQDLGPVQNPDDSFRLAPDDTIASITAAHREACATARSAVAGRPLDAVVTGHQGGPRTLRWVYLQVLRELAHHCGHADILREQILAG